MRTRAPACSSLGTRRYFEYVSLVRRSWIFSVVLFCSSEYLVSPSDISWLPLRTRTCSEDSCTASDARLFCFEILALWFDCNSYQGSKPCFLCVCILSQVIWSEVLSFVPLCDFVACVPVSSRVVACDERRTTQPKAQF